MAEARGIIHPPQDLGVGGVLWRIDQPCVTQRSTDYPEISLKPNDLIVVQAGGGVQTGGSGLTWKRYVDPRGSNADRLYHGLIQIPGVHSRLVRILDAVGAALWIPVDHTGDLTLRVGYEDDDYSNNGYDHHDDGTEDQTKGVGPAWVTLTVLQRVPARAPSGILGIGGIGGIGGVPVRTGPGPTPGTDWTLGVTGGLKFAPEIDLSIDPPKLLKGFPYAWAQVQAPGRNVDSPPMAVTGTALLPRLSQSDNPFTHPFGIDWECFVAPDAPYHGLVAPGNRGTPPPARNDYAEAAEHAASLGLDASVGVLGVEWEAALIPPSFQPQDGERVAISGRWIADAGHPDATLDGLQGFHLEIHPPLLLARAGTAGRDTTTSTLIGRPYLAAQLFEDGKPMFEHIVDEVAKAASPNVLLTQRVEAHAQIEPKPLLGATSFTYDLRPPTAGQGLTVRFAVTTRPGVTVQLGEADPGTLRVTVALDSGSYAAAPLPEQTPYAVGLQDLDDIPGEVAKAFKYAAWVDGLLVGVAVATVIAAPVGLLLGAITAGHFQALINAGVLTTRFLPPTPPIRPSLTTSPAKDLPAGNVGIEDVSQTWPVAGWIDVFWAHPANPAPAVGSLLLSPPCPSQPWTNLLL